jgi:flagellar motility protein MotE (MotC chaperone)
MIVRVVSIFTVFFLCFGNLYAASPGLVDDGQISSVEERRILVSIEDEYTKLRERESKIDTREMELKTLAAEVDKKLAAMQQLRNELVKLLDRKDATEGERIGELSKIYEKMNPQKAAVLITALDYQLAVDLLLGIKKKTAGKILDNLDPETATKLSKAFTEIPVKDKSGY